MSQVNHYQRPMREQDELALVIAVFFAVGVFALLVIAELCALN